MPKWIGCLLTGPKGYSPRACSTAYREEGGDRIESGCNHVMGARLKQAGMIRWVDGARAVATVRTWLKSGRWDEAMALRPPRHRAYQRRAA